jgi:hypothetical protein
MIQGSIVPEEQVSRPTVFLTLRPVGPLDDLVGNGIEPYHNDLTLRSTISGESA